MKVLKLHLIVLGKVLNSQKVVCKFFFAIIPLIVNFICTFTIVEVGLLTGICWT